MHSQLSAVIVTTPQAVALMDAMKCLSFTRAVNLPVIGLIENMSGYVCPCCGEISNVFSTGGGQEMARREELPFLGSLPIDTELVSTLDGEKESVAVEGAEEVNMNAQRFELMRRYEKTSSAKLFEAMLQKVLANLAQQNANVLGRVD